MQAKIIVPSYSGTIKGQTVKNRKGSGLNIAIPCHAWLTNAIKIEIFKSDPRLPQLCVMFGGRMAEEIIFHEVSTGAQNDLQRAADIARSMIKEYGMSDKFGPLTFEKERRSMFLDVGLPSGPKEYSEETARELDQEVKRLIDESYRKVKEMLTANQDKLRTLATVLLERETLEGDEIRKILGIEKKKETA